MSDWNCTRPESAAVWVHQQCMFNMFLCGLSQFISTAVYVQHVPVWSVWVHQQCMFNMFLCGLSQFISTAVYVQHVPVWSVSVHQHCSACSTCSCVVAHNCKSTSWSLGNIITISGLHHYECVTPLVANSLQRGRFWARSTASVHDSPWESRSFCTVFIHDRPGGLFQYTEGKEVKICLMSTLSSIRAICPNRVRHHAWIISVSRGWSVWRLTSSLQMKWYHLMQRSIWRHHWWRALILCASSLVIAQHSEPYRKIGNIQVL